MVRSMGFAPEIAVEIGCFQPLKHIMCFVHSKDLVVKTTEVAQQVAPST